ncbi:MBL fold metallo-hydrolase [Aegicerativicinus sediminis]|uniref:MBL fold metallo-hydrolase n=1 Tax=Aegicerativicinus sediminis TaxID=2893202 RepID=UPI001E4275EB|nr:MBL fold metallo-hydrolase [Aegicerativicinus sediminis]
MNRKQYGAKPSKENIDKYNNSPNWTGSGFKNLEQTEMSIKLHKLPKILYQQLFKKKGRSPEKALPIETFHKDEFIKGSNQTKFIWYGHSTLLMRINNINVLIDPMFGSNAAPISPLPIRRFSENTLSIIDDLPEIDLVLLSHDHYDHLDLESIQKLIPKVGCYFVALGVSRHLEKWGVPKNKIIEFDWWDGHLYEGLEITFTPTRHFSGRRLSERAKSLWGGWAIKSPNENIWFSGDSGYGGHFKEIGERLGPFNFAFMECGQYNENWSLIHMFPEESVQAAVDAKVQCMMPVHWGAFALAPHFWQDPVNRFSAAAKEMEQSFIVPKLGEIVEYTNYSTQTWWHF